MTFHFTLRFRSVRCTQASPPSLLLVMRTSTVAGFSLIEVLVALVIVALIAAAYITAAHTQSRTLNQLQDSLYSQQVAWNQSLQYQLDNQGDLRETDYEVKMVDHDWAVNIELEKTLVTNFFQLRVEVGHSVEQPSAVFINYIAR